MTYDWTHGSEECGSLGRPLLRVKPEVTGTLGFVRSKGQTLMSLGRFAKPHFANGKRVAISRVQHDSSITSACVKRTKTATQRRQRLTYPAAVATRATRAVRCASCRNRLGNREIPRSQVAPHGLHPAGRPTRPAPPLSMSTLDTRPKAPMV